MQQSDWFSYSYTISHYSSALNFLRFLSVKNDYVSVRPRKISVWVVLVRENFSPEGVLPYMGYIGMCSPEGYGFSAVLVINSVSI